VLLEVGLLAGDGAVLSKLTSGTGLQLEGLLATFTIFIEFFVNSVAVILLYQVIHVHAGVVRVVE
jgi:hypothetical protein